MVTNDPFPVYIGYDSREDDAYTVCRRSLVKQSSIPLYIVKLNRWALAWPGREGIFTRGWRMEGPQRVDLIDGKPFSTEFSFTRFLVPLLQQYEDWALFQDCDFLWRADVAELLALADPKYAVMCVRHDHRPHESMKMDGQIQTTYFRKNWSSLVLWNCGHPSNRQLTRQTVNNEPGSWLHGFQWLREDEIGALPVAFNWLEGWSSPEIDPAAVHFTRGVPSMPGYENCQYADEWFGILNERL